MLKTFQYRLYPTKRQIRVLSQHLEECRWLWNTLLAERKQAWEERQESLTYRDQQDALPAMKRTVRPSLAAVHALVVQDMAHHLTSTRPSPTSFAVSSRGRRLAIPASKAPDATPA